MEDLQAADHKLGVTAGIVIFLKAVNGPYWSTSRRTNPIDSDMMGLNLQQIINPLVSPLTLYTSPELSWAGLTAMHLAAEAGHVGKDHTIWLVKAQVL